MALDVDWEVVDAGTPPRAPTAVDTSTVKWEQVPVSSEAAAPSIIKWEQVPVASAPRNQLGSEWEQVAVDATPTQKTEPFRGPTVRQNQQAEPEYSATGLYLPHNDVSPEEVSRRREVLRESPHAIGSSIVEGLKQAFHGAIASQDEQYARDVRKYGPAYDPLDYGQMDRPQTDEERQAGDVMASGAEQNAGQHIQDAFASSVRQANAMPRRATSGEQDVIGGISSGITSAASVLGSQLMTGSPLPGIAAMGYQSGAQRYAQVRASGVPVDEAQASSLANGALEVLTEYIPGEKLVKHSELGKKAVEFFMSDILGENASNLEQLADDYRLQLRDDVTGQDLLDSMRSTTVQSLTGGAVQVGASHAMQSLIDVANAKAAARDGGATPQPAGAANETSQETGKPDAVPAADVLGKVEPEWEVVDAHPDMQSQPVSAAGPGNTVSGGAGTPGSADERTQLSGVGELPRGESAASTSKSASVVAPAEESAPPVAAQRADPRLEEDGYLPALEGAHADIGQVERQGRVRLDSQTGEFLGRSRDVSSPFWKARPQFVGPKGGTTQISAADAHDAIDKVQRGEDDALKPIQKDFIRYSLDEVDVRRKEWAAQQIAQVHQHERDIRAAVPDFADQDETTQDITMLSKVAAQYATEDEVHNALEAQDDREAIARLQTLIDRGWQAQPQTEGETNGEAQQAPPAAAQERLEQPARQSAAEPVATEAGGEGEVPADGTRVEKGSERGAETPSATPNTDLFGANVETTDALNKRNAKVARKLGEGRTAPAVESAPRGDIFREQAETARAAAEAAQTDIERTPPKLATPRTTKVGAAAHEAATSPTNMLPEPTTAQREAGNYQKGHVSLHGLDISIENPKGSHRWKLDTGALNEAAKSARLEKQSSGIEQAQRELEHNSTVPKGFETLMREEDRLSKTHPRISRSISKILDKAWHAKLGADYGYIKEHIGNDKDHLDVYLGPRADSENAATPVFVMDQKKTDGKGFDEHKVFMGFSTESNALSTYVKSFDDEEFAHKIAGPIRTFESVDDFKKWLDSGDLTKPVGDWKNVERSGGSLEQSGRGIATQPVREKVLPPQSGRTAQPDHGAGRPAENRGQGSDVGAGVHKSRSAPVRSGSNLEGGPEGSESARSPAGGVERERGADTGEQGLPAERIPAKTVERSATGPADLERKRAAQKSADTIKIVPGDRRNIGATLPFLEEGQKDDVAFAEARHEKPDGYGVVFTNGTGTGKTYTGLGIVKRALRRGKKNILVLAPSDNILSDWTRSGTNLGIDITQLPDTQSAGEGVVSTTYANFQDNPALVSRRWDLIVADESHYLTSNEKGELTKAARMLRAIALHPDGVHLRTDLLNPAIVEKLTKLRQEYDAAKKALQDDLAEQLSEKLSKVHSQEYQPALEAVKREVKASQGAARPRVTFLSATPFAYVKSIEYAEGFLFDYPASQGSGGYNKAEGRDAFFVQHFGYQMRHNKLTRPEADVDSSLMEIQFNNWLKEQGVLSSRILDSDADYERKFVLVESAIGKKIDDAIDFLLKSKDYSALFEQLNDTFNYLARMFTLEAIKARAFLPMIRAELAAGRKVVLFHDYNKGGAVHPFRFHPTERASSQLIAKFEAERPDLAEMDLSAMSPLATFQKEFPNALFINGTRSKGERRRAKDQFNDDNGKHNLIVVQSDAGREGISLHDTTGKFRRTLFNVGMPVRPVAAMQIEGRTRRTGSASDALYIYGNTGTNFERWTFASKIAERASTAENLAMGDEARGLKQAFIDAFENAEEAHKPSENDGKGGKATDRAMRASVTPFQKAKTFYFGQQKKNSRTKAAEGTDYYATPEPLGQKMVEWAGIRPKDDVLEPSAGHGAIARFFPRDAKVTAVEPSLELSSRAALVVNGTVDTRRFEDLHIVNKYDAIVMNPPFGVGGKTAIEHVEKAARHLKEGGRIVAIIPTGPMADKRFDSWMYGDGTTQNPGAEGIHLVANIKLPAVTFERAGTSAATRVVVLERHAKDDKRTIAQVERDYTGATDIKDFFDRIEHSELPPRLPPLKRGSFGRPVYKLIKPETKARTPVRASVLEQHLKKIVGSLENTKITVTNGFAGIPEEHADLYEWLKAQGVGPTGWGGVVWKDADGASHIYINAAATDSLSDAEKFLFHEATHRGFRAVLSQSAYAQLLDHLFVQMGGTNAFEREKHLYFDTLGKKFDVNEQTHRFQLVDEYLAHLSETQNRSGWRRAIDSVLAWVNRYFRSKGWRRTFSRAEVENAVRNMTEVGLQQAQRNDTIESPVREMAQFAAKTARESRAQVQVKPTTDAALALKEEDEQVKERQALIWKTLAAGRSISTAIERAFMPPGFELNPHGEWQASPLGKKVAAAVVAGSKTTATHAFRFMRPLVEHVNREVIRRFGIDQIAADAWEASKQALVDRYKTPAEFVKREAGAKNDYAQQVERGKKMIEDLQKSGTVTNRAEAEALQAIMSGDEKNVDAKMAAVSEPIRQLLDQWGAEAVELGLLDKATFERNRASYMHRVYEKREMDAMGASSAVRRLEQAATSRRKKIFGDQFKRRGMTEEVTVQNLRRALAPEWWGRKIGGKSIDVALGESDWLMLSKIKDPREGTADALNPEMDSSPRVVDRVYWPAEEPVPQKFAGWRNDGTFKAIKVTPEKVTLWRDFTKPERTKMGEILDFRYTFLKTTLLSAHDLSTGRLFRDISINPEWSRDLAPTLQDGKPAWEEAQPFKRKLYYAKEWVRVPDTKIPNTNVHRYGAMAGKYVLSSIWRDLNETEIGLRPGVWKWFLTEFKKNKTTRNPKTHIYNVMSNVILAYLDDMRIENFVKGLHDYATHGPIFREAQRNGLFGYDFVSADIKNQYLKPLLAQIRKDGQLDARDEGKLKYLFRFFRGLHTLDKAAEWLYRVEDEVFRMASYMHAREQGMAPDEAALHARKQYIDYDIRAPLINRLRSTVLPFISYTYRAIPRVMDAVKKRPMKVAKLALMSHLVNWLSYMLMDDGNEDEERRLMNEHLRGDTFLFTPRMMRWPANDKYDNPIFLDMRLGLPAASMFDFDNTYSVVPTPSWVQLGGPLMTAVNFMQNYDAYRQRPIADSEVDTTGQKIAKGASFLWSQYMPSWAPGGYMWDRVDRAVQGRMNQAHETSTIGMAVAQSLLPLSVQSTVKNKRDRIHEFERKLRKLSEQQSDLTHDFQSLSQRTPEDEADFRDALAEIQSRRSQVLREQHDVLVGPEK